MLGFWIVCIVGSPIMGWVCYSSPVLLPLFRDGNGRRVHGGLDDRVKPLWPLGLPSRYAGPLVSLVEYLTVFGRLFE